MNSKHKICYHYLSWDVFKYLSSYHPLNPMNDTYLISPCSNENREMIPNIRSFDCYIYSPYHYQRKFIEKSMEDMDTDVVAKQWIQLVIICQQVLIGYGYFNGNKVLYMITYIWSEGGTFIFSPLRVSKLF